MTNDSECWLNTKGTIVLGHIQNQEHVQVSLSTNAQAQSWLEAIPEGRRECARRAVTSELAKAAERIKEKLVREREARWTRGAAQKEQSNG